jgi:hypothetical protein
VSCFGVYIFCRVKSFNTAATRIKFLARERSNQSFFFTLVREARGVRTLSIYVTAHPRVHYLTWSSSSLSLQRRSFRERMGSPARQTALKGLKKLAVSQLLNPQGTTVFNRVLV